MKKILFVLLALSIPVMAGEGDQSDRAERFRQLMASKDADGDGRLTQEELGVQERSFRALDSNEDGFVTPEELAEAGRRRKRGGGGAGERSQDRGPDPERAKRMVEGILERLDKDGDGKLSPEELPADGRLDFSKADRNQDGFVDRLELTMAINARRGGRGGPEGLGFSPEGLKRMIRGLKEMDVNGDGRIEKAEWKGREGVFQRLDEDQDGAITRAEIKAAIKRMGGHRGRAGEALFRRADKDGDGRVSKDEWPLQPEFFARFDANGDGFITREEVMAKGPRKLRGRGDERSGKDSAHFLGRFDRNGDGVVSPDEFPHERRFSEIDRDGDGLLSKIEIEEAMDRRKTESGYGFLERFDLDGDGKVTREEFTGPARVFERRDVNHDGVIDAQDEAAGPK